MKKQKFSPVLCADTKQMIFYKQLIIYKQVIFPKQINSWPDHKWLVYYENKQKRVTQALK